MGRGVKTKTKTVNSLETDSLRRRRIVFGHKVNTGFGWKYVRRGALSLRRTAINKRKYRHEPIEFGMILDVFGPKARWVT